MGTNEMQDRTSQGTIPYHSENDRGSLEFVAIQNSEYAYTNSRKSMVNEVSAPLNHCSFNTTFTKNTWKIILNIQFANWFDQDSVISDDVAKNIEEGMADINSGRTYTSDQVKEMLEL